MPESLNIIELISNASIFVQIIMGILFFTSILSWILIFRFSTKLNAAKNRDNQFLDWFYSGDDIHKLYDGIKGVKNKQGLEEVFTNSYAEYQKFLPAKPEKGHLIEAVEKNLRVNLGRQQQDLETGLSALASIGSVSPYIGLLGTVWGIMNAFLGLSQAGQANIASVAPGIAEALIATAMGLFAAIPAVLAYNHFTTKSANLYEERTLFCDELTGLLLQDSSHYQKQSHHTMQQSQQSIVVNEQTSPLVNENPMLD